MRRRFFCACLGVAVLATPVTALGQAVRIPKIGFLGNSTPQLEKDLVGAFREGLRDHGHKEGQTIEVEYKWAEGRYERLPPLVEELVADKVEVIVTAGTPAALAVTKATKIPLVMVAVGDPVGTGLAETLAHPGGTATGLSSLTPDLEGKRLQLIREVLPTVSRLAVLWNPANAYQIGDEKRVREAADVIHMPIMSVPVRTAEDLDAAFSKILAERADAVLVLADRIFLHSRARIVEFANDNSLPTMNAYRELVEAGGLMSFGPSYAAMHRRAAFFVDKILKGASPADLPIEQPTKFEFVLNSKAAQQLGLTLPPAVLARVDEVIE